MDRKKTKLLALKMLVLATAVIVSGCSDSAESGSAVKELPWWETLTEDTIVAIKSSSIPVPLQKHLPLEIADFVNQHFAEGTTVRVRMKKGSLPSAIDYAVVSGLVFNGTPLDEVEDAQLLSAYNSAITQSDWEIRLLFPITSSTEINLDIEKSIISHNQNLISQVGEEIEGRGLKIEKKPPPSNVTSVLLEKGRTFLQIGTLSQSPPVQEENLMQVSYEKPLLFEDESTEEWVTRVFLSPPSTTSSPDPAASPKIQSWTPGHRAANAAIDQVLNEWENLTGTSRLSSLTEVRASEVGVSLKTLIDTSGSPWIDLQPTKPSLEWVPWPSAIVQVAFLSQLGSGSPFTTILPELLTKQLSLLVLPSALESSVLMTEAEADENVNKQLLITSERISSVIGEIKESTVNQINFALWSSPSNKENMALWVDCESVNSLSGTTEKITTLIEDWTEIDLSAGLHPVQLKDTAALGWSFGSPHTGSSSDLFVGIDTKTQTAATATSAQALEQVLFEKPSLEKETIEGLIKLTIDAKQASLRLQDLSTEENLEDLGRIREWMDWLGRITITAKIIAPQVLELHLETLKN